MGIFNLKVPITAAAPVPTVRLLSGYELPVLGLGTYAITGEKCVNTVAAAINMGYRLIDSASFYGNEREVGNGVRRASVPREQVFVQTKLYPNQYSYAELAIDEALSKLNLDYIDMMLLHHPAHNDSEAYAAIERAIKAGKVRTAGISCYYERELSAFLPKVTVKPDLIQNEVHPYYQDMNVVPFIQSHGIVVQSWYPLGGRGYTAKLIKNQTLQEIAAVHHKSVVQVILRWQLQRGIVPIPGSSNPAHLKENLEVFDFELSPEQMAAIAALDCHEKHDWY